MPETDLLETETVETEVQAPSETQQPDEFDKERAMATINKLRQFEKEAKANAKKLEAFEKAEAERKQAEMSEIDKLKAQIAEAEAKAARLEKESLQRKAADEAGLPLVFADRIRGESLDEMVADAKGLLEAMPKPDPKKTVVNPTNPGQGAGQGETDDQRRKRLFG